VQPIERRSWDVVAPSAAVNTSAMEMAQWMRLNLGEPGVYRGNRLLSERVMLEMHRPQVALGGSSLTGAGTRGGAVASSAGQTTTFSPSCHWMNTPRCAVW
jgi:hypothetical protein